MIKLKRKITAALLATVALGAAFSAGATQTGLFSDKITAEAYVADKYDSLAVNNNFTQYVDTWIHKDPLNYYKNGSYYYDIIDTSTMVTLPSGETATLKSAETTGAERVYGASHFDVYYGWLACVFAGYYTALYDIKMGEYDYTNKKHYITTYATAVQEGYQALKDGLYDEFMDYIEEQIKAECDKFEFSEMTDYTKSEISEQDLAKEFKSLFDEYYDKTKGFFSSSDILIELDNYYNSHDTTDYEDEWITALKKERSSAISAITQATTTAKKESALSSGKTALDKLWAKYDVILMFEESEETYSAYSARVEDFKKKCSEYESKIDAATTSSAVTSLRSEATSWNSAAQSFYSSAEKKKDSISSYYKNYTGDSAYSAIKDRLTSRSEYFKGLIDDLVYSSSSSSEVSSVVTNAKNAAKAFIELYEAKTSVVSGIQEYIDGLSTNEDVTDSSLREEIKTELNSYITQINTLYSNAEETYSLTSDEIGTVTTNINSIKSEADKYYVNKTSITKIRNEYKTKLADLYQSSGSTFQGKYHLDTGGDSEKLNEYYYTARGVIYDEDVEDVTEIQLAYDRFYNIVQVYTSYCEYLKGATDTNISVAVVKEYTSLCTAAIKEISDTDKVATSEEASKAYGSFISSMDAYIDTFRDDYKEKLKTEYSGITDDDFAFDKDTFETYVAEECEKLESYSTPDEIYSAYTSMLSRKDYVKSLFDKYKALPVSDFESTTEQPKVREYLMDALGELLKSETPSTTYSIYSGIAEYIDDLASEFSLLSKALGATYGSSNFSVDGNANIKSYRLSAIDGFFKCTSTEEAGEFYNGVKKNINSIISLNESFADISDNTIASLKADEVNAIKDFKADAAKNVCSEGTDISLYSVKAEKIAYAVKAIENLESCLSSFFTEEQTTALLNSVREDVISGMCSAKSESALTEIYETLSAKAGTQDKDGAFSGGLSNIDASDEKNIYYTLKNNLSASSGESGIAAEAETGAVFTESESSAINEFCYKWAVNVAVAEKDRASGIYTVLKAGVEAFNKTATEFSKIEGYSTALTDSEKAVIETYRLNAVNAICDTQDKSSAADISSGVSDKISVLESVNDKLGELFALTLTLTENEITSINAAALSDFTSFMTYASVNDDSAGTLLINRANKIISLYNTYKTATEKFSDSTEEKTELDGYREKDIAALCDTSVKDKSVLEDRCSLYSSMIQSVCDVKSAYNGVINDCELDETALSYVSGYKTSDVSAVRSATELSEVTSAEKVALARAKAVNTLYIDYTEYMGSDQYSDEKKAEITESYLNGIKSLGSAEDSEEVESVTADTVSDMRHLPMYAVILIIVVPSVIIIFLAVFLLIFFRCKVVYRLPDKERTVFAVKHLMPGKRVDIREIIPERDDFDSESGILKGKNGLFELEGIYKNRKLTRPAKSKIKMRLKPRTYYLKFVKVNAVSPKAKSAGDKSKKPAAGKTESETKALKKSAPDRDRNK